MNKFHEEGFVVDDIKKFKEALSISIEVAIFSQSQGDVIEKIAEDKIEKQGSFFINRLLREAVDSEPDLFVEYNYRSALEGTDSPTKGVMLFFGVGVACGFMVGLMMK